MDYFEIYLIGVVLSFFGIVFLIEKNSKDTAKFSFGIKLLSIILASVFSWIFIIGMSANMLGQKFKR